MYSLVGARAVMENLVVLASTHGAAPPRTLQELRRSYREQILTESGPPTPDGGPRFVSDGAVLDALVRAFDLPQRRHDVTVPAPVWRLTKAVEGWHHLLTKDEGLGQVARTVVGTVFVSGADWNGSMSESRNVGTLWIMPGRDWHIEEVIEAYLHELTHTLLFLDERRYGHFLPAARDRRVRSAIRQDEREYAAVVHSVLVAAELLAWRDRHDTPDDGCRRLHGPTAQLAARAREAHAQVIAEDGRGELLMPRMRELVEASVHVLHQRV
jgi:hypothetical protein